MEIKRDYYLDKLILKKHNGLIKVLFVASGILLKMIIMKDVPAPWYTEEGILVMSIYDFLLRTDSLEGKILL